PYTLSLHDALPISEDRVPRVRLQVHRRGHRRRHLPDVLGRGADRAGPARREGGGVMARLKRFEDFRYVGVRDTMRVYDCDDPEQFADRKSTRVNSSHVKTTY